MKGDGIYITFVLIRIIQTVVVLKNRSLICNNIIMMLTILYIKNQLIWNIICNYLICTQKNIFCRICWAIGSSMLLVGIIWDELWYWSINFRKSPISGESENVWGRATGDVKHGTKLCIIIMASTQTTNSTLLNSILEVCIIWKLRNLYMDDS